MIDIESGKYTKEHCKNIALKYDHRKQFSTNDSKIYDYARRYKILDEICSHMKPIGNRYNRCIYAVEFPDNSVYIGLTYNLIMRKEYHLNKEKSTIYKKIKDSKLIPEFKQLTEYLDKDIASLKEQEYVENYKKNNWIILNKVKAGNLGGDYLKWTKEKCQKESLKYKTRIEFQENNHACYESARRNGWLKEICSHMEILRLPDGYWTKEVCHKEALKYQTIKKFHNENRSCYEVIRINKWSDELYSHMISEERKVYWTKEKCQKEALKYKTKKEFRLNCKSCYMVILKKKWIDELCSHMVSLKFIWTKEKCQEESLKYNTKKELQKNNTSCYNKILKMKWFDELCSHMNKNKSK